MQKKAYNLEFIIKLCEEYLESDVSYRELQEKYGVHPTTLVRWTKLYREQGKEAFEGVEGTMDGSKYQTTKKRVEVLEQEVSVLKEELKELAEQVQEIDNAVFEDEEVIENE